MIQRRMRSLSVARVPLVRSCLRDPLPYAAGRNMLYISRQPLMSMLAAMTGRNFCTGIYRSSMSSVSGTPIIFDQGRSFIGEWVDKVGAL